MKHLLFILALAWGLTGYSQNSCGSCNDVNNYITATSGTSYSAASAQAYYWEICAGPATISGSNTNQTVTVSCTGTFTIKVTRFVNGSCVESCETRACGIGPIGGTNCPTSNNIGYSNEGADGLCTTGLAYLNGVSNVQRVDWTWALGPHTGSIPNGATAQPIYYPSGNWTGYYIVICAKVTFNDGTACDYVCKSFLLNCGVGGISGISFREASIYPNPAHDSFSIETDESAQLVRVVVSDGQGQPVKVLKGGNNAQIDMSGQQEGMYFVRMEYEDGRIETKILTLEQ